ncbi:MAG: UDP-glucose 4-epimerase GalE [bacterium]|nr:UDP-glucose 4-epimerase GalE [bacterium]
MKVLVTGGAGYVGSHCARALCDAGHEVVVYDDLRAGHRAAVDARATLVEADLADSATLNATFASGGFEGVMHFAASLDVAESVRLPLAYYENNVVNTIRLLRTMEQHGVRRLVFSSTCATYGVPESVPITEGMLQDPINPYGHTKLAIEWALRDSATAWDLGACALRYFNAAGAAADGTMGEDHDPEPHLIPIVLQVAMGRRDKVFMFGVDYPTRDGTCVRDYIHVEDLASAHLLALESQKPGVFRRFNVGTGRGTSVKDLIDAARSVTGHAIPAEPAPRRPGDPPELYADPSEIASGLGWKPKYTDIREVVETAWEWHRSHPQGYGEG